MNCKKKIFYKLVTLTFLVFTTACNTTEPIPVDENIRIAEIDAAVIETYLNIHISNPSQSKKVVLERNGQEVMNFTATNTDTAITDTGLTESTLYKYKARLVEGSKVIGESSEVSIRTMQPTSHEFTWQTFTFGEGSSSILYDVAIINDTLAYAVGEIYMKDSTGQPDPLPYNFAKWNGKEWSLKRVTVNFRGNLITPPLEGIFSFSSNQIWLVGSLPIYGNGAAWTMYDLRTTLDPYVSLSKAWGSDPQNMYFVGRNGSIVYYTNGTTWQKIESGTSLNINDIFGAYDNKTNQYEVLAVASNILESLDREVVQINDSKTKIISKDGIKGTLSSIWFKPNVKYYVGGGGIYVKNKLSDAFWKNNPFDITRYYTYKIRGIDLNDIAAVGGVGELLHYNGRTWKSYINEVGLNKGNYYSVSIKDNLIVAAGYNAPQAVIAIGRR